MNKIRKRKVICSWLVLAMAVSGLGKGSLTVHGAQDKAENSTVLADIYPKPQVQASLGEGMTLTDEINIIFHGEQEAGVEEALSNILSENGYEFSKGTEHVASKSNILVSSSKTHCSQCQTAAGDNEALDRSEGYVLVSSNAEHENGDITIVGSDADGAYWGVMTLRQILQQKDGSGRIAEVKIGDYPEIGSRGYVEGFYGTPWTYAERASLIEDTSKYKMNTYIYAPKDDAYHRAQWRDLYPADKQEELKGLAETAKANNVNFCWTLHPGETITYDNESDYNAVIKKFEQLYDLGVRQFGVLFDDLSSIGSWAPGTAEKQVALINRIDREFVKRKGDIEPMIVISTRYNQAWGPEKEYFEVYMRDLNEDIQLMWTGGATMTNVSHDVFEWPKEFTGVYTKDVAAWWNYPVNDYAPGKLLMAPLHNLGTDLDNVTGFFSNPMNQADASKVTLFSIADYTWNTDSFEYKTSWERSIEELVPEASDAFKRFAEDTCYLSNTGGASGDFLYNESWNSEPLIEALNTAIADGSDITEPAAALMAKFQQMKEDAETLKTLSNENLASEIDAHRQAYAELGVAGESAIKALLAAEEGKLQEWSSYTAEGKKALENAGNHAIGSSKAQVGTQYLRPAVTSILEEAESRMEKAVFSSEVKVTHNGEEVPCDITIEDGGYVIQSINVTLEPDEALQIALPEAVEIGIVTMEADGVDNLKMETSLNGIEWIPAETTVEDGVMKMETQTLAAYIRFVNDTEDTIELHVSKLTISLVPPAEVTLNATTNMTTYQSNLISNAADGNMNTMFWSYEEANTGKWIQVDLGSSVCLYDIKGYFGETDNFKSGIIQISTDEEEWTSIGEITYKAQDGKMVTTNTAGGQTARYFRFWSTADQSEWVQLYEIEVKASNKKTSISTSMDYHSDPSVPYPITNAIDGDMETRFYSRKPEAGDWIQVDLGGIMPLYDINAYFGATDNFAAGIVEISIDGDTWTEVGPIVNQQDETNENRVVTTNNANGQMARYFRFITPTEQTNWIQLYEVTYNTTNGQSGESGGVTYASTGTDHRYVADRDLSTAYAPETVSEGDILTYKTSNVTNVGVLRILQDRGSICNATVYIRTADKPDEWSEIGILDSELTEIEIRKTVLEIKLEFHDDNPTPKIYEIIPLDASEVPVDKADLEALVDKIVSEGLDGYTDESAAKVEEALAAAQEVLGRDDAMQKEVDEALNALEAAYTALVVDKTALETLVDEIESKEFDGYTEASVEALNDALEKANTVLQNGEATVDEVSEALDELEAAYTALEVDKTALKELVDEIESKEFNGYTEASVEALNNALAEANTVLQKENATVDEVSEALDELEAAYTALEVDKTALKELVDEIESKEFNGYTEASIEALNNALAAANTVLENEEATVDDVSEALDALDKAYTGLVADKTALAELIGQLAGVSLKGYTDESVEAFEAALSAARTVNSNAGATPAEVSSAIENLKNAYNGLAADKTELGALIGTVAQILKGDVSGYTPESVANLEKELENAQGVFDDANATVTQVQTAYNSLQSVYNRLEQETKPPADKAELENLLKAIEEQFGEDMSGLTGYTEDSSSVLKEAVEEARNIYNNEEATDEQVEAAYNALNEAYNGLETDKTALAELIGQLAGVSLKGYTDESVEAFEAALTAARAVNSNADATPADVSSAIENLKNAYSGLAADKTELGALIDTITQILEGDVSGYTPESVANLEKELENAQEVFNNTNATVAEVQTAYDNLQSAYDRLEQETKPPADKAELENLLKAIEEQFGEDMSGLTGYTEDSSLELQEAVEEARTVYNNEEATAEQVEMAYNALYTAYNNLETDKSEFETLISQLAGTDLRGYTAESIEAFEAALTAAREVNNNVDALPADVSSAIENLKNAYSGLAADKTELGALIDTITQILEGDVSGYTPESVANLEKELENAQEVFNNTNATVAEVQTAYDNLQSAYDGLEQEVKPPADKAELENLLKTIEEQFGEDMSGLTGYTEDSSLKLQEAVEAARTVYNSEAATAEQIEMAYNTLHEAYNSLEADKSRLSELINQLAGVNLEGYTAESMKAFEEALAAARAVNNNGDALPADVSSAIEGLENAYSGLTADKTELGALIDTVTQILGGDVSGYTSESVANLQKELENAQNVFNDANAAVADVQSALERLSNVLNALEPVVPPSEDSGQGGTAQDNGQANAGQNANSASTSASQDSSSAAPNSGDTPLNAGWGIMALLAGTAALMVARKRKRTGNK